MAEIVYLSLEQVMQRVHMPPAKIFDLISRGEFPKDQNVSGWQCWDEDEVDEWLAEQR